ncbi:hypothetical protein IscW_ISCW016387, partial [Ixodes scapularis]
GSLDYETVNQKLKYLGQVINETMRIWPAALTTERGPCKTLVNPLVQYPAG